MRGNIYLIGPMGSGKTTAGRRLAELLRWQFLDTDRALEERTGVSVSHIFEIEGEQGFREREAKLLAEIAATPGMVVATGGGIILREENRRAMRKSGEVIYMRAPLELLWSRLRESRGRPLLDAPQPKEKLAQLLEQRAPLYAAEADHIVDVRAESASRTAAEIHALLQSDESR